MDEPPNLIDRLRTFLIDFTNLSHSIEVRDIAILFGFIFALYNDSEA